MYQRFFGFVLLVLMTSLPSLGQNHKAAATPRTANGKVDLSGVWVVSGSTLLPSDPAYQPAQVYQQQVRVAKMVLGGHRPRTLPIDVDEIREVLSPKPLEGEEKLASILEQKISEFAALDRYERRALSRRKAAIRNFDAARTLAVTQ